MYIPIICSKAFALELEVILVLVSAKSLFHEFAQFLLKCVLSLQSFLWWRISMPNDSLKDLPFTCFKTNNYWSAKLIHMIHILITATKIGYGWQVKMNRWTQGKRRRKADWKNKSPRNAATSSFGQIEKTIMMPTVFSRIHYSFFNSLKLYSSVSKL